MEDSDNNTGSSGRRRPRAVFMAFGTQGDVHPVAAIAAAFASDQEQYDVSFVTHSAHKSLSAYLEAKNVCLHFVSSPPTLSTNRGIPKSNAELRGLSFIEHKKVIQTKHRQECLFLVELIFGDCPSLNGDFFLINFFALEGWSLAELFQVKCVVAAPYAVPYSSPASFERQFRRELPCDSLTKVYPANDGSSDDKLAVQGLSLAVREEECFGLLGPNGAGKTSFINMIIGLTSPTSEKAYVQGLGIRTEMNRIYTNMGVCPQHDMLWECLTGREHLLFFGRLKNLKGPTLLQAVDESLRSVNLLHGGFADKRTKTYSGGMKRRLSVAISLIGDPKVVYMDEPSSGLDPASRKNLWNVVKNKSKAERLFLPLKARHGGSYVFTITTSGDEEQAVEDLANQLSPRAKKIYHISGTQKLEIPKEDVMIADIFKAVECAKAKFSIQAWGLSNTTLEDVFIKVASEANFLL